MKNILPANPETCPRCYVGRIKPEKITLVTMVSGQLLSVPDFPAWVCDVCHAFIYDPQALRQLHAVLSPSHTGSPRKVLRKPTPTSKPVKKTSKRTSLSGN